GERADGGEHALLREQAGTRDEPTDDPEEGVLLALEREGPGGQEDGHEHKGDRGCDRRRERSQRRLAALHDRGVDAYRGPHRAEDAVRQPEVLPREVSEPRDLRELGVPWEPAAEPTQA